MAHDPSRAPASRRPRRPTRSGWRPSSSSRLTATCSSSGAAASHPDGSPGATGPCSSAACARPSGPTPASPSPDLTRPTPNPPSSTPAADTEQSRAQSPLPLRAVRHRRGQPPGPRRRAGRRRAPRPGLQPAVPPCAARTGQDPPAARDRQLRRGLRGRHHRALHDRRVLHQPLHQRAQHEVARRLQARLPRRRRAADRRRPVPGQQGQDRGGVLSHLQRAVRERPPAGADLRPAPARAGGDRAAPARALRGRPGRRHQAPRPRHARHDPAQARGRSTTSRSPTRRSST